MTAKTKRNHDDIPAPAKKLAKRIAGLDVGRNGRVVCCRIVILPDGTWLLSLDNSDQLEKLGK